MLKQIMSVIEGILAGILIWQVFIPTFLQIGDWQGYYGLVCFIIIVVAVEYQSYKKNELTWLASHFFGNLID